MPALVGKKGAPRDNEVTRSGRKHIQRLLAPSLEVLEEIIYGPTDNACDRTERRKTAQYVIDQNIGRAAFTVHGQLDIHRQEVVFAAFLAGGDLEQLPEADRALLTGQSIDPVIPTEEPGTAIATVVEASQVVDKEDAQGTEPCDDL